MNDPKRHTDPLPGPPTPYEAHHQGRSRRVEAGVNPRYVTEHHLDSVRSRLDEAIESCTRRESQADPVETGEPWQFAPRHLTEIDTLRRLRDHLDRLAERFRHAVPPGRTRGEADPMLSFELALVGCADMMSRRFKVPDDRHDLLADLDSDLCAFERLLDERARAYEKAGGERQPAPGGHGPAALTEKAAGHQTPPPARDDAHPGVPKEDPDVFQRVDRRIAEAAGAPPLQRFWRGVKMKYREEASGRLLSS